MDAPTKPAEFLRRAREIEAAQKEAPGPIPRLSILASFTADFLKPYLVVESHRLGAPVRPWFGPFNTFEQLILDDRSALWTDGAPDVLWIAMRVEDVDGRLYEDAAELSPEAVKLRLRGIGDRLIELSRQARMRTRASILVSNLSPYSPRLANVFEASDPDGLVHLVHEENRRLAASLRAITDAHVFDWAGLSAQAGAETFADPRLWYMGRLALSADNQIRVAKRLARSARALLLPPGKCLVVDLDNTLWGGVLGDDGPEGLKLGHDYPGNVFLDVQAALLGLRKRGFLLAIASKNDEDVVLRTLDSHPEMLLRRDHFAAIAATWDEKPESLRKIAGALNLGLEALIFIDDNPVERARVRAELPMVEVVELPPDPLGYLTALREVARLDQPRILEEDRKRASMVEHDAARRALEQSAESVEAFLEKLEMVAEVGEADGRTQERIHQLIQKTNQFNLTTRRHKLEDLKRFIESPEAKVAWLRLRDRYGDLGLVAVGIVRLVKGDLWEIDSYLMSCRVMGRGVEEAFLAYLAEIAAASGARRLRGVYLPTAKNHMVRDFYPKHGFEACGDPDTHELDLDRARPTWPAMISREDAKRETR